MVKKLVSILLTLCLCVGLCPALAEDASTENDISFGYCRGLTKMGDRLLVYADDGSLFTTTDGETWTSFANTLVIDDEDIPYSIMNLTAAGDTVYMVTSEWQGDSENYALYSVKEGSKPTRVGDLALTSSDGWIQTYGMAYVKDTLYLLYMGDSRSYGMNTLVKISTEDASVKEVGTFPITEMQAYKDGLLLVCYQDWEDTNVPSLASLNPETKEVKTLIATKSYNCGGIAWDEDTDTLFFADASTLYRVTPGSKEAELCATLIPGYGRQENCAVALGGKYFLQDYNADRELFITSTNPADMPTRTLRLAVSYADDTVRSYVSSHKDVAVQVTETAWDAETLTQSMVTGSDAADVYSVSLSSGFFPSLRNKGYCVDLSSSQKLMDFVSTMYPSLTGEFFRDGKLYGIPVDFNAQANFSYYPSVLSELGLTEDDLPKTWLEMLDFIQRWDEEIAPDTDDEYALFTNDYDIFSMLFGYILEDCMLQSEAKGESIRFSTPETLAALKRLEELRPLLKRMSRNPDESGDMVYIGGGDSMPEALIANFCELSPQNSRYIMSDAYRKVPLPLTLAEGDEVYYAASIRLYIVNPNSKNQELATEFLEYVAEHLDKSIVVALDPTQNDPVESPYYQTRLADYEKYVADAQTAYDEASEEDKAFLLDNLNQIKEFMEEYEATGRWDITPEAIAAYREIAPHLVVSTSELLGGNVTDLSSIFQRFMDGQMSAEQFAKEFDRIIMMMEMENQ